MNAFLDYFLFTISSTTLNGGRTGGEGTGGSYSAAGASGEDASRTDAALPCRVLGELSCFVNLNAYTIFSI